MAVFLVMFVVVQASFSDDVADLYDAESWEANPDDNYNGTMWVGRWDNGAQRAHLFFDLLATIPPGAQITQAEFEFYVYQDIYGSFPIVITRILEDWDDDDLTWNNQPNIDPSGVAHSSPTSSGWNTRDVTDVIQEIVDSGMNYGIVVRKQDENSGYNVSFAIIEEGNQNDTPPVLHVEWGGCSCCKRCVPVNSN